VPPPWPETVSHVNDVALHTWLFAVQFTHALPPLPHEVFELLAELGTHLLVVSQQPLQFCGPQVAVPHEGTIATRNPKRAPKERALKFMGPRDTTRVHTRQASGFTSS
jgi:hypothetical protein